jgi:nitrous-oxide reductase
MSIIHRRWLAGIAAPIGLALALSACSSSPQASQQTVPGAEQAALTTYVPGGKLDEYYMFTSGGHSGQVFVYGIPSMRRIRTLDVFSTDPATGYGFSEESRAKLNDLTWGDTHHPALSETNGDYDGRWLFINDNANARIARINLQTFQTDQVLGPVPNLSGLHGGPFVTPNSEYVFGSTRFSIPLPKGSYAPLDQFKDKFFAPVAGIKLNKDSGEMKLAWEILLPPIDLDLADAGKLDSDGWMFFSSYNSEMASTNLEVNASQNDRDFLVAMNWKAAEEAANANKGQQMDGVQMLDPRKTAGLVYLIPVAKSPHGSDVSPDGKYIVASGKLASQTTVFEFAKIKDAIAKNDTEATFWGLPVLKYDSVRVAEVPVGNGPLHTQFDGQGFAYTSLFVDSAVAKWRLGPPWDVVDTVPVQYNVGHIAAAEGDTEHPAGHWLVALNKLSKDRYLSVGPSKPESLQLIDISGEKMKVVYDAPVDLEPHYAQIIKADKIKTIDVYPKDDKRANSVWTPEQARVERNGNDVKVYMMVVRSHFTPDSIEVNQGDHVTIYATNIEQTIDESHGLGIDEYNVNMQIDPGETKTIEFTADKPGVFAFYCTNFCSALHQEMQGYLLVKPH